MNQQRSRRFRSARDAEEVRHCLCCHPAWRTPLTEMLAMTCLHCEQACLHLGNVKQGLPADVTILLMWFAGLWQGRAEALRKGEVISPDAFDSNCITPGTPFMARLGAHLRYFVRKKIAEDPAWQRPHVIFSGNPMRPIQLFSQSGICR